MSKRIALGPVIALLCAVAVLSAVVTGVALRKTYNAMLAGLPDQAARYAVLDELEGILREHYYGSSDEAVLRAAVARGYVSGLNDGYSRYLTAEELRAHEREANGEMQGVGLRCSRTAQSRIRVDEVIDGSPAQQQGIVPGDVISAVDSIPVNASNYDESAEKLQSGKSSVELTVRGSAGERTLQLPLGFEAASVVSDNYGDVGYLRLTAFYAGTAAQVRAAVDAFVQSGVRSLVIDLRRNGSENVKYAMQTLDVFVPLSDEPAARLIDQSGETVEAFVTDAAAVNLPLAVLVGENTQAAAELFACDLRNYGKATLVGTPTAGLGLVRQAFRLSTGDAVLLCVGEMLPYRGESFNGTGLEPDVAAAAGAQTASIQKDSQFLSAVAVLRGENQQTEGESGS
ncbi:MAG: PDZ domain-containing protein [Clostridia bacterium]|jgi:carboxyl-terminal processing protease|nr:PDZ domain-containing protein [Clostridia bacterium]